MMVQYGDTVQYNAAAFNLPEGATALDLVSRLPGIFIVDGKIKARGKEVFEVLLDGKKYYDTDAMRALISIPASALDNIQLYDQQSDNQRLTGFKDGKERQVFNARTKKPFEPKGWANAAVAEGLNTNGKINNLYGVAGDATFDTPQHRLATDLRFANVNGIANRFAEAESQMGALRGVGMRSVSTPMAVNINTEQNMALEYGYSKEKLKINLSGRMFEMSNNLSNSSSQRYFPVEGVFTSKEQISHLNNHSKSQNYNLNLTLEWTLHKKHTLRFASNIGTRETDFSAFRGEDVIQDGDSISRMYTTEIQNGGLNQLRASFNYFYRISPGKRALTFGLYYDESTSTDETTPKEYVSEIYDEATMSWISSATNYSNRQFLGRDMKKVRGTLDYNETIRKNHQLKLQLGVDVEQNPENRLYYGYNSTGSDYSLFLKERSSDMKVDDKSYDTNLSYSFIGSKKLRINAEVGASYLEQEVADFLNPQYDVKNDDLMVNSDVKLFYKPTQYDNINLNYKSSGQTPGAQDLSPTINDNNAAQITIGNPNLKNSYDHRVNFRYSHTKKSSVSIFLSANWQTNAIVRLMEFMPANRDTVIYAVNYPADTVGKGYVPQRGAAVTRLENRSGTFRTTSRVEYSKRINSISSTISTSVGYDFIRMNLYDSSDEFTKTHQPNFTFFFMSNITKSLELKFGYSANYSVKLVPGSSNVEMFSQSVSGEFALQFLKIMRLTTSGAWSYTKQSSGYSPTNSVVNIDAGIGAYLDKNRSFLLSVNGKNLLDSSSGINDYMFDTYTMRSINDGFGRYVTIQVSYKFNSMQKIPKLRKGETTNSGKSFDN